MYRIQAHNIKTGRIEVIIVHSMDDRMRKIAELQANPAYGLIEWEHNPRGSFYY